MRVLPLVATLVALSACKAAHSNRATLREETGAAAGGAPQLAASIGFKMSAGKPATEACLGEGVEAGQWEEWDIPAQFDRRLAIPGRIQVAIGNIEASPDILHLVANSEAYDKTRASIFLQYGRYADVAEAFSRGDAQLADWWETSAAATGFYDRERSFLAGKRDPGAGLVVARKIVAAHKVAGAGAPTGLVTDQDYDRCGDSRLKAYVKSEIQMILVSGAGPGRATALEAIRAIADGRAVLGEVQRLESVESAVKVSVLQEKSGKLSFTEMSIGKVEEYLSNWRTGQAPVGPLLQSTVAVVEPHEGAAEAARAFAADARRALANLGDARSAALSGKPATAAVTKIGAALKACDGDRKIAPCEGLGDLASGFLGEVGGAVPPASIAVTDPAGFVLQVTDPTIDQKPTIFCADAHPQEAGVVYMWISPDGKCHGLANQVWRWDRVTAQIRGLRDQCFALGADWAAGGAKARVITVKNCYTTDADQRWVPERLAPTRWTFHPASMTGNLNEGCLEVSPDPVAGSLSGGRRPYVSGSCHRGWSQQFELMAPKAP